MSTARFVTTVLTEKSLTDAIWISVELPAAWFGITPHVSYYMFRNQEKEKNSKEYFLFTAYGPLCLVILVILNSVGWALLPYQNFAYIVKLDIVIRISPPVIDLVVKIFAQIYIKQGKYSVYRAETEKVWHQITNY